MRVDVPAGASAWSTAFEIVGWAEADWATASCRLEVVGAPSGTGAAQPSSGSGAGERLGPPRPQVTLAPARAFRLGPAAPSTQALVTVRNPGSTSERYSVVVADLPAGWYSLVTSDLAVEPGGTIEVPLRLHPSADAGHPPGRYDFRVLVVPYAYPDGATEVDATLTLEGA